MPTSRPLALGYQSLRLDSSEDALIQGERVLIAYAFREGYTLGAIYTDRVHTGRLSGFEVLLAAVAQGRASAVIVPSLDDLGRMPRVRQALQLRLGQVANVRLLVATR